MIFKKFKVEIFKSLIIMKKLLNQNLKIILIKKSISMEIRSSIKVY